MIPTFRFLMTISAAILTLGLIGCSRTSTDRSSPSGTTETAAPPATVEHEHASAGPHGGSLIELGEEEFHAEMVHDDKAGNVTIYILDGTAKASSPIEATSLTINLKHEGRGEQFNLAASPDAGDPPASRPASSRRRQNL